MSQVKPITKLSVEDVQRWRAIARSLWLATLLFFIAPTVCALDPTIYLSQYAHTAWRVREGYFSAAPLAIAQTSDGRLWIGSESGLVQFDGVRFVPWKPPDSTPGCESAKGDGRLSDR